MNPAMDTIRTAAVASTRPPGVSAARRSYPPLMVQWSPRRAERFLVGGVAVLLLLSAWGPALITVRGLYVPELVGFPLILYGHMRFPRFVGSITQSLLRPGGVIGILWLTWTALLGVIVLGARVGAYSEWRATVVLLGAFLFLRSRRGRERERWLDRLLWVALAVLCLDTLFAAAGILWPDRFGGVVDDPGGAVFGFGRVSVPAITIVASTYAAAATGRLGLLVVTLVLGGVLSLGGHRVVLAATAVSALTLPLAVGHAVSGREMLRTLRSLGAGLLVLVVSLTLIRPAAVADYLDQASGIQYRLFTRTADTIAGIAGGVTGYSTVDFGEEGLRAAYAAFVLTEWLSLLLPHGLGSREIVGNLGPEFDDVASRMAVSAQWANTHDNALLYAAYHHGLLVTGIVLAITAWLVMRRLRGRGGVADRGLVAVALLGMAVVDLGVPSCARHQHRLLLWDAPRDVAEPRTVEPTLSAPGGVVNAMHSALLVQTIVPHYAFPLFARLSRSPAAEPTGVRGEARPGEHTAECPDFGPVRRKYVRNVDPSRGWGSWRWLTPAAGHGSGSTPSLRFDCGLLASSWRPFEALLGAGSSGGAWHRAA